MTLIEFFEKSVVEDIFTSIAHAPDRVIPIGHQKNLIQKHAIRYRSFFENMVSKSIFNAKQLTRTTLQLLSAFSKRS